MPMRYSVKIAALLLMVVVFPPLAFGLTIPALCYHQVVPNAKGLFEITPDTFREQLSILKARGYTSVNSQKFLDIISGKSVQYQRPILLTFDDGYKSVFDYALPIMKEFGFVGVACIYPQFIGCGNSMSWNDLRRLASEGWTIECHSYSHINFGKIPGNESQKRAILDREISRSKQIMEEQLGKSVLLYVWPYGIYTEETEEFARKAGYIGALTVDGGCNYTSIDPFRIKRQVIYRTDNQEKFLIRLEMGGLKVTESTPKPGEVLESLTTVACVLPELYDYSPQKYILNAKVTGGVLNFQFDAATRRLSAKVAGSLKEGQHFIDVYLRDKATGITCQNGWLFTIKK